MKWHGSWLHGVHRTRWNGSSSTWHQPCQRCKYTTSVDIQKRAIKTSHSCRITRECNEFVWERRIALYKSDQQQQQYILAISMHVTFKRERCCGRILLHPCAWTIISRCRTDGTRAMPMCGTIPPEMYSGYCRFWECRKSWLIFKINETARLQTDRNRLPCRVFQLDKWIDRVSRLLVNYQIIRPIGYQSLRTVGYQILRPAGYQSTKPVGHQSLGSVGYRSIRPVGLHSFRAVCYQLGLLVTKASGLLVIKILGLLVTKALCRPVSYQSIRPVDYPSLRPVGNQRLSPVDYRTLASVSNSVNSQCHALFSLTLLEP